MPLSEVIEAALSLSGFNVDESDPGKRSPDDWYWIALAAAREAGIAPFRAAVPESGGERAFAECKAASVSITPHSLYRCP